MYFYLKLFFLEMIFNSFEFIFFILYSKFVQISSYSNECNDYCDEKKNSYPMNCFCTECEYFNDCCANRPAFNKKTNMKCSSKISGYEFIYSIDSCPKNFTIDKSKRFIKEKCENNNETFLPYILPIYSIEDELIYKNIFCASCNFKNLSKIIMFSMRLDSNLDQLQFNEKFIIELLNGKKNDSTFELIFEPPDVARPRFCKKAIDSCPSNYMDSKIIQLCSNSTAFRYDINGKSYKNEYCAICNDQHVDDLQCSARTNYFTFVNSLQILFDLSELNEKSKIDLKIKYNEMEIKSNNSFTIYQLNNRECNEMLDQDITKKYLTIIGQVISISSLSLLILIYVKNKLHGNLPGKMLVSLSLSLLLSQLFFLISTYVTKSLVDKNPIEKCELSVGSDISFNVIEKILPCYITGLMTHFFHLNFFIWTSLMAFDLLKMFQTFGKIINDNKKFIRYTVISIILPIIGIGLLHLKNMNKLSYGIRSCFISNSVDILLFFVAPISTALFLNLLFLFFSIYFIKKVDFLSIKYLSHDKISNATKSSEKSRLLLFIKLFILTGMTWIIGVISSLMNKKYSFLWYFYIILNSLQGLFIFCTYGFNHNSKSNLKSNVSKIMSYFTKEKTFSREKLSRTTTSENVVSISK